MKATVNNSPLRTLEATPDGLKIDGELLKVDLTEIQPGRYHLIANSKSITVEVISSDTSTKKHVLKVNGTVMEVNLRDQYDDLLQAMGMDVVAGKKTGDLKAPMPGLVVDIPVQEGQDVKKGETLVVLEAMKMENSLKAPGDGTVKKVLVQKGNTVEKNQVLIQLG